MIEWKYFNENWFFGIIGISLKKFQPNQSNGSEVCSKNAPILIFKFLKNELLLAIWIFFGL